jgi:putative endonuclease
MHNRIMEDPVKQPVPNNAWRSRKGGRFEQLALAWLQSHGLRRVQSNYRCVLGEIDLIMRDRDTLVFVEVRFRGNSSHVAACETVDHRKQRKLLRTAQHFLLYNRQLAQSPCRFDVLGISSGAGQLQYQWIRNAFN